MLEDLCRPEQLERILAGSSAVIYKHSTRCSISSYARREVEEFAREHPELAVYRLDVVENRSLSDRVARQWSVPHESPQVLVVRGCQLVWHGSHFEVTATNLRRELG